MGKLKVLVFAVRFVTADTALCYTCIVIHSSMNLGGLVGLAD